MAIGLPIWACSISSKPDPSLYNCNVPPLSSQTQILRQGSAWPIRSRIRPILQNAILLLLSVPSEPIF
ncbi:hypothetical protein GYH30_007719 [Glycine max]|uniref:Uncharacterized protein n=1 Tax=Glycine max TaxID=3847 RepID=K7KFY9_SOYBN|nr:hypothetical protein GYH30_007719 [Glycine max]